jgi:hypothetical protein
MPCPNVDSQVKLATIAGSLGRHSLKATMVIIAHNRRIPAIVGCKKSGASDELASLQ